jgi:hypothetical protein
MPAFLFITRLDSQSGFLFLTFLKSF